jgi:hypothetical protein
LRMVGFSFFGKKKRAHVAIFRQTITVFLYFSTSSLTYSQIWLSALYYFFQPTARRTSLILKKKKKKKKIIQSRVFFWFFFCLFFPQLCGARCSSKHPHEVLAKFGYRSERKIEKFRNCACRTYCLNLAIVFF